MFRLVKVESSIEETPKQALPLAEEQAQDEQPFE